MRIPRPLSLLALLGTLTVVLLSSASGTALAAGATVRCEATGFTVLPATTVQEPASGGTYYDLDGSSYRTTEATAFGATALALDKGSAVWDFAVSSYGVFVDSFAGQAMAPDYSGWWAFAVNGYSSPLGAAALPTESGDAYLWFQNADNTWSRGSVALVIDAARALAPGQDLTVQVKADDLAKVNSASDADRFGITDPSQIQTPAEFPMVSGATVYVGNRSTGETTRLATGSDLRGRLAVEDLAAGTYYVWAQKAMDGENVYARSDRLVVNVGSRPSISRLRAWPRAYRRGRALTVRYRLSKRATVKWTVSSAGRRIASGVKSSSGGLHTFVWRGATAKKLGKTITVRVRAVDQWGRTSAVKRLTLRVDR